MGNLQAPSLPHPSWSGKPAWGPRYRHPIPTLTPPNPHYNATPLMEKKSVNAKVYERSGDAFQDYPRDNPLGAAPGRCAAGALPSFRTPKETRAGKGTCNLLAPPPRGGSTPVSP